MIVLVDRLKRAAILLLMLAAPLQAQQTGIAPVSAPQVAAASGPLLTLGVTLDSLFDAPAFENAFWGVSVQDAATGEVLYARNPRKSFVPASNTKLYTTAAALDRLGADFTFVTRVYADGPITNGTLKGNVVVRGSGDPVIGGRFNDGDRTETFRAWARDLRARGITRITGDIVGDDDLFDDVPLGYGWNWDDETYWYSAQLSALSFNDNCVDVAIKGLRTGAPARVTWEPGNTQYVQMINETETRAPGFGIDEGYDRARGTNRIVLTTEVGRGTTDYESLSVENPTLYFAYVLRDVLRDEGIRVEGDASDVDDRDAKPDYEKLQEITAHTSPPLSDIVSVVNKESQNLYADLLLKTLGAQEADVDAELEMGSHARGWAVAAQTFAQAGIDTSRIHLVDGSGLSRGNWITPEMSVALLRYFHRHPDAAVRKAFYDSLPIGGIDGTLRSRFRSGVARENVHAKTGSLGGVSSLAGYVTTADGRVLAFSLMCNHYVVPTSAVRDAQDAVMNTLASIRF